METVKQPKATPFEETSSIVKRLKAIIMAVILLIILGFMGIYLSSKPYLEGLQEMKSANMTMTSLTFSLEALDSSNQSLDQLISGKKTSKTLAHFEEGQRLFKINLKNAIKSAEFDHKIQNHLIETKTTNAEFEAMVINLLRNGDMKPRQREINLQLAQKFSDKIQDEVRGANLMTKNASDRIFSDIYAGRLKPLIAGIVIAMLFLSFVVIFGFSITDRLRKSLQILLKATEEISRGNYYFRPETVEKDEMGKVTHAFNEMLDTLIEVRAKNDLSNERINILQKITAAFSEALTSEEMYDIIVEQGFEAVNAEAGGIGVVSKDHLSLEFQRLAGFPGQHQKDYPLEHITPSTDAIRFGKPIFIENTSNALRTYPQINKSRLEVSKAVAALPLTVGSDVLGVLVFSYRDPRTFSSDDKEFMLAVARQSAQALHRAQLFENTKLAIQSRDEFLSIASHELKTPLTPLKLQLQGLSRQLRKNEQATIPVEKLAKIIESSDKQITRLARLIENLLDVSRIAAGKLSLNKEITNFSHLIDEVVKNYAEQLKDGLDDIQVKVDKNVEGMVDKIRMEQVLINMLTNAAKYAPGKPVLIEAYRDDGHIILKVSDNGPGVQPGNEKRIFERFERVKVNDNIGGLGLGLYISRQIVEAHGGKISVVSPPGEGATFVVETPIS